MSNDNFTQSYLNLLIKQYYYKPKARAEITVLAKHFSKIYDFYRTFIQQFDIDSAIGYQLDMIGKIVGVSRTVPEGLFNYYFGFSGYEFVKGFNDKFKDADSAPFSNKLDINYSDLQLTDNDYRFFIKAKVATNNASAYMISNDRSSIQEIVSYVFNEDAYVIDNQNMSITLFLSHKESTERIRLIQQLNLLPKPQGVSYHIIIKATINKTFGFKQNPNSIGFNDKFNLKQGYFAEKVLYD